MLTDQQRAAAVSTSDAILDEEKPIVLPRYVCAWCNRPYVRGKDGRTMYIERQDLIASHGLCTSCFERETAKLRAAKSAELIPLLTNL